MWLSTTDAVNAHRIKIDHRGRITFQDCGTYLIVANANFDGGAGDFHLFYRLNSVDVPDSNVIQTISSENEVSTLVNNLAIKIQRGDYLEIVYSTTNSELGLITLVVDTTTPAPPTTPSIIVRGLGDNNHYEEKNYNKQY
ncbi:unnamed protein product [Didymodactylos carnosus]|uniref:TNF family profile domain-containing protein n=1 Tax=Didymodactylos carnosus TaxID=1234261 RepID=A0A815AR02_9BILA|nr:unnamed protein product [Didymodactylos carnosus]CAF4042598.1 unnamed protein product [Didymodactylos carnosus]